MIERPKKALVEKTREVHMYAELWHASHCVLRAGLENEHGSSWQFLSSLVLTAFAFEAYMNHVGAQIFDCWPSIERLGPMQKFDLIRETLKVDFPNGFDQRPLQTIRELFDFRNAMAHGKSETLKPKAIQLDVNPSFDERLGHQPLTRWERLIQNKDFPERVRLDVETVLTAIQERRPNPKECLFSFGIASGSAQIMG